MARESVTYFNIVTLKRWICAIDQLVRRWGGIRGPSRTAGNMEEASTLVEAGHIADDSLEDAVELLHFGM